MFFSKNNTLSIETQRISRHTDYTTCSTTLNVPFRLSVFGFGAWLDPMRLRMIWNIPGIRTRMAVLTMINTQRQDEPDHGWVEFRCFLEMVPKISRRQRRQINTDERTSTTANTRNKTKIKNVSQWTHSSISVLVFKTQFEQRESKVLMCL